MIDAGLILDRGRLWSFGRTLVLELGRKVVEDSRSSKVDRRCDDRFDLGLLGSGFGSMLAISIMGDIVSSFPRGSSADIDAETIIGEKVHTLGCVSGWFEASLCTASTLASGEVDFKMGFVGPCLV